MHYRPKKSLGQNFLIDRNIQKKIIKACNITSEDTVLEIGAGRGELTRGIAEKTDKLFALEIDPCLGSILKDNLADFPWVKILNQNILRFDVAGFFRNALKIKIIGNLPYNITTPIIVHLLKFCGKIESIFITIQKEFAQRMVATEGNSDWSAFSCFLQYYTEPRLLFLIKRTCFYPQPKVDSAFVELIIKDKVSLSSEKEKELFKIIRAGFQQRRKTLRNALSGIISSERLTKYFNQYNIDRNIRGERLSLQDFINLSNVELK